MRLPRRTLIKGSLALLSLIILPRALLASVWPGQTFMQTRADEAMTELFGTHATTASDQINLKVPEIAENGAVVPVTIDTTLENVESISIVVKKNPRPMAATFEIPAGTLPKISSRIKMGQTSDVMAVIKTPNGLFSTSKQVKVTIGGCGG